MDNFLVIKQHLIDAGCDEKLIDSYLSLHDGEQITQQLNMLIRHRSTLLTALHKTQRQIDCLDYLIYNIKKNNCCKC